MTAATPRRQLDGFVAKFTPEIAAVGNGALAKLRKRLKGAVEMVYDNYLNLAIGFGARERPSEAILSVVLFPKKVVLCFIWGAKLPDPEHRLRGGGNQVRSLTIESAATLDEPAVKTLIARAVAASATPFDPKARGRTVIRAVQEKQMPRRPRVTAAKRSPPPRPRKSSRG